jgi:hypothetical protein
VTASANPRDEKNEGVERRGEKRREEKRKEKREREGGKKDGKQSLVNRVFFIIISS